jgi:hypothetical protein
MTINLTLAKQRYQEQKNAAIQRKLEWQFDFQSWLNVWIQSGKWDLRGKGIGKYCMSRLNDCGPYSPANVFIQSHQQNSVDAHKGLPNPKVAIANAGRVPWNKGKVGVQTAWNKGVPMSEETKKKLSKIKTKHGKYTKYT